MYAQRGFTLVELVMVITLLGILSATATACYRDLSGEASNASVDGVAGALGAAALVNQAACTVGAAGCVAVAACPDAEDTLTSPLSGDYSIDASGPLAPGDSASCTVNGPNGTSAAFTAIGTTI